MAYSSLQELQRGQITRMLDIGGPDAEVTGVQTFKALVYDKFCKDVLAPLLTRGALQKRGVSFHGLINVDRHPLPDVPVVYFVEPTEANVNLIIQDLRKGLYENVSVNFASSVPRSLLQELARGALQAKYANKVHGVVDRFVSFVSLAPSLFSLHLPETYATIHSPLTGDQLIQQCIDRIVDGLLSVLITTQSMPIIRCPPNAPVAGMVAAKVEERIRELLRTGGAAASELFTANNASRGADWGTAAGQRPLLCILERDVDLVTMLNHTWTYQAMAHDLLDLTLNKLHVMVDGVNTSYDVDENDAFWAEHAGDPFPNVGPAVCTAIEEFDKKRQKMTQNEDGSAQENVSSTLVQAMGGIPEMTEKKRCIDRHTNIATALLKHVNDRDLAHYYEMEDQFSSQSTQTSVSQIKEIFKKTCDATGLDEVSRNLRQSIVLDKARALMVLYLTKPKIPPAQLEELMAELDKMDEAEGAKGYISAIKHLRHLSGMRKLAASTLEGGPGSAGPSHSTGAASLLGSVFSRGEGLLTAGFNSIQNIMPSKKELVLCQILDGLMDQKPGSFTENYNYLDPKVPKTGAGQEAPRMRAPFQRAITFVIGGGNYAELQAVQEWAQERRKQVTYGSTDLVSPARFAKELCHLGNAQSSG